MVDRGWASEQLIQAAQDGDPESLVAVVHGAHPHVRRFAESLCASPQDAEDAAQEALIILYRKIGSLRATAALASWMFRIVRHEYLRRARRLLDHHDEAGPAPAASAEDEALERLEAERLAEAIRALPDDVRVLAAVPEDRATAAKWKEKHRIPFPVLTGHHGSPHDVVGLGKKVFGSMRQSGSVLVDRQGVVRHAHGATLPTGSYDKAGIAAAVAALRAPA
ncbi:sigma factor [Saccharothrix sp. S26]|uniref:sigma factor n=1 Tax=Saccharothrix sp. S26 TaxID=2907215 RepID=UPI0035AC1DF1